MRGRRLSSVAVQPGQGKAVGCSSGRRHQSKHQCGTTHTHTSALGLTTFFTISASSTMVNSPAWGRRRVGSAVACGAALRRGWACVQQRHNPLHAHTHTHTGKHATLRCPTRSPIASRAPGLPMLKGPMWSSLSITRTMPSIRSDTYWKLRVCWPSPNSVSGSFFSACGPGGGGGGGGGRQVG